MECQVKKNERFSNLLPYAFNQGCKAAKAADFHSGDLYHRGTENPAEHWEEVVNNKGEYIID